MNGADRVALNGQPAPRIHDLEALAEKVLELGALLQNVLEAAKRLTDYAVDSRYPDAPFDFTADLARQAQEHALAVKRAVLKVAEGLRHTATARKPACGC